MLPKTPPKVKELATKKDDPQMQRSISVDITERTARNFSVDLDPYNQDIKFRKEIAKLKQRNDMLENENMELHKLRIQNENQIVLWTQKARRLNDQLIRIEQESLREITQNKPYDANLKRQVEILSQQMKNLASSNVELQQKLNYQKQKSQSLERKCEKLSMKDNVIYQLQAKVSELEEIVYRISTEKQRCEANLARNELYVNKLQGEVQYLTKQIKQQLNQLSQEKLELANKEKSDALKEARHFQYLLKTQQLKIQEQSLKVQELNSQLRKTKEQFDELKQEKRTQLSRLRINSNESENIIKQLRQDNDVTRKTLQLKITRLEAQKQQKETIIRKYQAQVSHLKLKVDQLKKLVQKKQIEKNKQIEETIHLKREVAGLKEQISILNSQLKEKQLQIFQSEQGHMREAPKTERRQNGYEKQGNSKLEEKYYSAQHKNPDLETQIAKFQQNQRILVTEIQILQKKLKEQRIQGQQLVEQLQMSHLEYQKLQLQLKKVLEQLIYMKQKDEGSVDLLKKIREQDALLVELTAENQRWKSYRLSEEDEARRQARRHKKKVEQLQQQLINEKNINSEILQQLQNAHDAIQHARFSNQKDAIEQSKLVLNAALNEMQVEFKKLLNECEQKLASKQKELESISKEMQNYERIMQKQRIQIVECQKEKKNIQVRNQQLRRENINVKDENIKLQNNIKKGQMDSKARAAIISQAQREAKNRYEAALEQKVVQVQRLKLELKDIQQLSKKEQTNKRLLQSTELKLRLKQKEELQKNQRIKYLQKMLQTFESEVRSYKNSKEELLAEIKNLQRDLAQSKGLEQRIRSLQNDLYLQKAKYERLMQEKMRDHNLIRQLKQKYEDSQTLRQKINSSSNLKEKQLQTQIRDTEKMLDQKAFEVEQLQSQCERYRTQIKNYEEKERFLKRQIQEMKYRSNTVQEDEKTRRVVLQEKHYDNQAIIEEQKRVIQNMTLGQKQSHQEITILLEKIAYLEAEIAAKTATQMKISSDKKFNRRNLVQRVARQCGLPYIDQQTTLGALYQWVTSITARLHTLQGEVNESRKLLSQLKQDKQNLSQKYLKYKSVAMQYKERKQVQRLMLRNTYRFNDQILTHCQNIIKGTQK